MQFETIFFFSTYCKYCYTSQLSSPYSRKKVPLFYCIAQGKSCILFWMWLHRFRNWKINGSKKNTFQ